MNIVAFEAVKNQNSNTQYTEENQSKTNYIVIIDLTSFLKYNIARLFRYLKTRYLEADFIAYINNHKPEFSGKKKLKIYDICSKYNVRLFSTRKAARYMLRIGERETLSPSSPGRKMVLVSNSKFMIEKYMQFFQPEEVEFIMLSSTYYEPQFQEMFNSEGKSYTVIKFKIFPEKLECLKALLSLSVKEAKIAKGFFLKKNLNQKLLDMLPASVWKLKEEIEKYEKYKDKGLIASARFLLHNRVKLNPKTFEVRRVDQLELE